MIHTNVKCFEFLEASINLISWGGALCYVRLFDLCFSSRMGRW